jgi:hypothetical protein
MGVVAGPLDLLDDEAPAGRPLEREVRVQARESLQPLPQRLPRRRADAAAANLATARVERLERDLPAMNIESTWVWLLWDDAPLPLRV